MRHLTAGVLGRSGGRSRTQNLRCRRFQLKRRFLKQKPRCPSLPALRGVLRCAPPPCSLGMVFLGSGSDESTEYLKGTDLLPVLEAAVEAMLEETMKPENQSKKPEELMSMLAAWLKDHNPKRDPEMAAKVQEMRDALAVEAALKQAKATAHRAAEAEGRARREVRH